MKAARPSTAILGPLKLQCLNKIGQQIAVGIWVSYVTSCYVTSCSVCPGSSVALGMGGRREWEEGGEGGGEAKLCNPLWEQIGIIYCKHILPLHMITNNLQMANKLLHVLFPYKVSKITQDSK